MKGIDDKKRRNRYKNFLCHYGRKGMKWDQKFRKYRDSDYDVNGNFIGFQSTMQPMMTRVGIEGKNNKYNEQNKNKNRNSSTTSKNRDNKSLPRQLAEGINNALNTLKKTVQTQDINNQKRQAQKLKDAIKNRNVKEGREKLQKDYESKYYHKQSDKFSSSDNPSGKDAYTESFGGGRPEDKKHQNSMFSTVSKLRDKVEFDRKHFAMDPKTRRERAEEAKVNQSLRNPINMISNFGDKLAKGAKESLSRDRSSVDSIRDTLNKMFKSKKKKK